MRRAPRRESERGTANPTCDEPDVREVRSSRMREMVMLMVRCRVLILEFRYYCLRGRRHVRRRHLTHSTSNAQVLTGHEMLATRHTPIESDSESPGHPRGAVHPIFRRACACEHMPIARCAQ